MAGGGVVLARLNVLVFWKVPLAVVILKKTDFFLAVFCGLLVCLKRTKCLHAWHRSVFILSPFLLLTTGQKTH